MQWIHSGMQTMEAGEGKSRRAVSDSAHTWYVQSVLYHSPCVRLPPRAENGPALVFPRTAGHSRW